MGALALRGWDVFAFAMFVLFVPRTLPILAALLRTPLSVHERLVAAWFGPRGFAFLLYGSTVRVSRSGHEPVDIRTLN